MYMYNTYVNNLWNLHIIFKAQKLDGTSIYFKTQILFWKFVWKFLYIHEKGENVENHRPNHTFQLCWF